MGDDMRKENISAYVGIFLIAAVLSVLVYSVLAPVNVAARGRVINGTNGTKTNGTQTGLVGSYTNNAAVPVTTTIAVTVPVPGTGGVFQNGQIVHFATTAPSNCTSTISALYNKYPEAVNASGATNCEIGVGINTAGMSPQYMISPAFAGLSIYGQVGWNSTPQGYPTFNKTVIVTSCGASTSPSNCSATSITKYFYSPGASVFEKTLGYTKGLFGEPQGVMAKPAHDLLIPGGVGSTLTETYLVRVAVFDPNIFPNATTGACRQWVASNLTNPTGNCLNNVAALARALNTTDTAVANANKNNILFLTKDIPSYQATITIYTMVNGTVVGTTTKNVNASNTNVVKWVLLSSAQTTTVATTTVPVAPTSTVAQVGQSGQTAGSNNNMLLYAGVVIVVIIVIVVAFVAMRRKK
jgi:hypothetical protein